ncbi:hypothetical protein DEM27_06490 [Metarhizobium album]|uniref:Uncharacterized protein n=1 Tax=Metarhizobium album TaxID=2182425 RepID=A0A2U2DVF9_9HYPH|nr:hypothetical protein DEM27_06490 [Rhizobium album]
MAPVLQPIRCCADKYPHTAGRQCHVNRCLVFALAPLLAKAATPLRPAVEHQEHRVRQLKCFTKADFLIAKFAAAMGVFVPVFDKNNGFGAFGPWGWL